MTGIIRGVPTPSNRLAEFAAGRPGRAIAPGDEGYDLARQVWNAAIDRRPALVVRAVDAAEVAAVVALARETGLPLAVRSGGHSLAGQGTIDAGIVLDLSALDSIEIDPAGHAAWAGGGTTAGAYTAAAQARGLATPLGDTATVGIGGLTLGGGIGWLVRRHGLSIDQLLAVELVTADGRVIVASEDDHADLFWALRGGGGNFGVATRFRFRLHALGMILGGALFLPPTGEVLGAHRTIAAEAPEELTTILTIMAGAPPIPLIPPDLHGRPVIALGLAYAGEPGSGRPAIAPYYGVASPLVDLVSPMPYPALFALTEGASRRTAAVGRSILLPGLGDAAIAAILEAIARPPSPQAMVQVRVLGGAMARVPASATAFAFRRDMVMVVVTVPYEDPAAADECDAWAAGLLEALRPGSLGVYVNFLGDEGQGRVREAYPDGTYERLAEVKARYDPDNLFRSTQNVLPSA